MSDRTQAGRRYGIRFGIGIVIYSLLMFTTPRLAGRVVAPWSYVLAAAPAIGVAIVAYALYRLALEVDEYQRLKLLMSVCFSLAATIVVGFAYGMCESVGAPHLSMVWLPPLWAITFAVAQVWQAVRDR